MITKGTAKGVTVWKARLGHGGKQVSFTTKSEAQEFVSKEQDDRRRLRAGLTIDAGQITYDKLCEAYLSGYSAESKTWTENMLLHSRKKFGKSQVRAIRPETIGTWLTGLPLAPKTKRHILERMRCVLNAGVEWGYLGQSPARPSAVKPPSDARVTEILPFSSWSEVTAVSDAMTTTTDKAIVKFACSTGLRPGEWQALRWNHIDLDGRSLFVPGTKTRNAPRTITLPGLAITALETLETRRGVVFPIVVYYYWSKDRWRNALAKAGVEHRPPGQMRHTFATLALSTGIPIDAISKTMGHANIATTLKYYARHVRPSMERYADMFDQLEEA